MYSQKEDKVLVSANTSDTSSLSMRTRKQLLPEPNITRTRYGPRCKRRMRSTVLLRSGFVVVTMVFAFMFLSPNSPLRLGDDDNHGEGFRSEPSMSQAHLHRRLLQETTESPANGTSPFGPDSHVCYSPSAREFEKTGFKDIFTCQQRQNGAIALHIIGILYMFYALAIVCDEFFVPSLDVITETLGITPDVAGATFMAAGGSAPELFTSIIGVFVAKSDVGIGTIVGSAVFNILFVIAACAFAAKEALRLTAWPLIRDVFFYSVSLILLVAFFADEKIYWYEALIQFLWYGAYVGFMKWNEDVEDKLRACLNLEKAERLQEKGFVLRNAKNRRGLFHLMSETVNPSMLQKKKRETAQNAKEMEPLKKDEEIMIGEHPQGTQPSTGISGLRTTLAKPGAEAEGFNGTADANDQTKEMDEVKKDSDGTEKNLQHNNPATVHPDGQASKTEPAKADEEGGDDDEEEPINMAFPTESIVTALIYIVTFPLMGPLYITLPDTKNREYTFFPSFSVPGRKFFVWTFLGSIIWIAIFSYLMVWWATLFGDTAKIPDAVMGLTFLAAGTSVPDLITSVLVAKQGKGDMAVSSSVGSNIFDVTVGLPLPWLLYTAVNQSYVNVSSQGAACSIAMLFLMLILVFLAILTFKWQMTKTMGGVMLCLYVVFVVISLGFSFDWYTCPV